MLLRRITEHVKNQNWFAVVIDFVIVVVGVFIGIQVANWNEDRAQRHQEVEILLSLSRDIESAIESFDESLKGLEEERERQFELVDAIQGPRSEIDNQQLDALVFDSIYFLWLPEPRRASIDELKSSGRINIVSDQQVREHILGLEPLTVEVEQAMDEISQLVFNKIDPYLIKNYDMRGLATVPRSRITREVMKRWVQEGRDLEAQGELLQTLEFRNLLIYKMVMVAQLVRELTVLRDAYQETNVSVRARLTEMGK